MNFFSYRSAAQRYLKGRPFFHPQVVEHIRAYLALMKPVERALDVGCGTGLSTVALKRIAAEVIGVDLSHEMIALADRDRPIKYCVADAVMLPFSENAFDLITLSSAIHWLERNTFLAEAKRALRPGGWLIVYDNYFAGRMEENAAFETWYRECYLRKYPAPPRVKATFTAEAPGNDGFHLEGHERYQDSFSFSVEALIDYLISHSNVIAAVEAGGEDIDEVRLWLDKNLKPLFGELKEASFLFYRPIWYLRRSA